jgi:hypothetical protein
MDYTGALPSSRLSEDYDADNFTPAAKRDYQVIHASRYGTELGTRLATGESSVLPEHYSRVLNNYSYSRNSCQGDLP